ncbi:MAG: S9 family peptidase [Planctomycetes bacterium]|nr:S9 family peptidase [Planctomycetota bacterium]
MLSCLAALFLCAVLPGDGYRSPPNEVVELVDAPLTPSAQPSPGGRWMLLVERPSLPSIQDVARPWIGLAGMRVDPRTNAPHRTSFETGLVLRDLEGTTQRRVPIPEGARIGSTSWSHKDHLFAFTLVRDDDLELWCCDVREFVPRRVATGLNTLFADFHWMPDGMSLAFKRIPDERGPAPSMPRAPAGPSIQESSGRRSPVRTYQDLLRDEHDSALLEHFAQAQLATVRWDGKQARDIGASGALASFRSSPDGQWWLVSTLERPYSYVMTLDRFPSRTEVWDARGAVVRTIERHGLLDAIPIDGVPTGPRSVAWRAGHPTRLVWVEALDGGDPKVKVAHRDRWLELDVRSKGEPQELFKVEHRARGLAWFRDPKLVLSSEFDRDRKWLRATLHDLSGNAQPVVLEDRNQNDRYGNPGTLQMEPLPDGMRVVRQSGEWVYRVGEGDSPEGARPFLDRQSLATRASERLWRCESGCYELPGAIIDTDMALSPRFLTRRESGSEPSNLWLRDLAAGTRVALTEYRDPQPSIRGITRELVRYQRADGVQLSATLYLPAGYQPGTRLPLVVWAYPLEYTDASTAGQVGGSQHRFTSIRGSSHLFFLTQGYAVMDDATMPIVGDPETANDTFLDQIAAAAEAAIDFAVERGVADRERVGVGGHSYGAFMTANLLAHTDLFKAGCARSGAYNRTLTPFGFQSERRTLWEAPAIYNALSPFYSAHKINEPLLLIHGEKDANPGTFPIQSERLYQAIAGNGGRARWVVLPEEDHGYAARESVLHTLSEMIDWFDQHVKGAPAGAR